MITPFKLRNIYLLQSLQSDNSVADINYILAEPPTPLRVALQGYFLGARSGVHTYVLRTADHHSGLHGYVQARARKSSPAWNVTRLAPALDSSEEAATIWYRLLLHLCIVAGEQGIQRLFTRLPAESPAEEVFRQASFSVYAHERVFSRNGTLGLGKPSVNLHAVDCERQWDIQRLYHRNTPRQVSQVEEAEDLWVDSIPSESFQSSLEQQGYALHSNGKLQGYLCIVTGTYGAWLRMVMPSETQNVAAEMLDHGLSLLKPGQPVYCAVREYQGGMQVLLEERGFSLLGVHSLLVKHTTVRVKEPSRNLVRALEKRAEIAPTVSQSEAQSEMHSIALGH